MAQEMNDFFPILIAEDNPVSQKHLEKSLARDGYSVIPAENGHEALEILEKDFFPIVITDWMMPEKNGLELCRAVRSHALPGYVYIVLLKANDSKEDIIAGLEAGSDDYLTERLPQEIDRGKRYNHPLSLIMAINIEGEIMSITASFGLSSFSLSEHY